MKYPRLDLGKIEALANAVGGMVGVKHLLAGRARVVVHEHLISSSDHPFVPDNYRLGRHEQHPVFHWDLSKIYLRPLIGPSRNTFVDIDVLWGALSRTDIMNATVLDYLLLYPEIIPEEWENMSIYFLGTTYHANDSTNTHVRFLKRERGRWRSLVRCLEGTITCSENDMIAMRRTREVSGLGLPT